MGYERFFFWFWESPTGWHACKVKKQSYNMTLNCTLFAQRLPNDSLNDWFFQTRPLRDSVLRWLVISFKAVFVIVSGIMIMFHVDVNTI